MLIRMKGILHRFSKFPEIYLNIFKSLIEWMKIGVININSRE